eukprot:1450405-Rhodomonas_salina.1
MPPPLLCLFPLRRSLHRVPGLLPDWRHDGGKLCPFSKPVVFHLSKPLWCADHLRLCQATLVTIA